MSTPRCCFVECLREAEYLIVDQADNDPTCNSTEACTEHVGQMLGHRLPVLEALVNAPERPADKWMVVALEVPA